MARLAVPFIAVITGEGGSGGALAIAVADRVLMLENSIYSVISPEGCASIMWRDSSKKDVAAAALRITAKDNLEIGICDEVITEPAGGAHHDHDAMAKTLGDVLERHLSELEKLSTQELLDRALQQVPQHGAVLRSGTGGLAVSRQLKPRYFERGNSPQIKGVILSAGDPILVAGVEGPLPSRGVCRP